MKALLREYFPGKHPFYSSFLKAIDDVADPKAIISFNGEGYLLSSTAKKD